MTRPTTPPEQPETEYCADCDHQVIVGDPTSHDTACPAYQTPPPPFCSVCNPRPDEHEYHGPTGIGGPVFCDDHNRSDWKALLEHEDQVRREAREAGR